LASNIKIAWWSAGITSAVACKIAIELYDNVKLYYIETGKAHPDNKRFLIDCENWYGTKIETVQNRRGFKSPVDVIKKTGYVNGPEGARCTLELKKQVRYDLEEKYSANLFNDVILTNQVFGFEWEPRQINRAIRFLEQYPSVHALFPLIERKLSKSNCWSIIDSAGIEVPAMYKLGFPNNNCIGCVKGGAGYWNQIRKRFPDDFNEMAKAEREAGHSCIKNKFLDELDPSDGREMKMILPSCGNFCEVELSDIVSAKLQDVLYGEISIYEVSKFNLKYRNP
jgi:3'-phosphoadenosine 5'-phosphosulfate sulfotransferase (PAPS reductase)/FAD synthetase